MGHPREQIDDVVNFQVNLLMDRRPSAGANVIPQAALCQHRYSLQLNGDGGIYRVGLRYQSLT